MDEQTQTSLSTGKKVLLMKQKNNTMFTIENILIIALIVLYWTICLITENDTLISGVLHVGWLGKLIFSIFVYHITMIIMSLYLHRSLSHRSIELAPSLKYFCRFWIWMTLGINRAQFVAQHRFHHLNSDKPSDPLSPLNNGGVLNLFLYGYEIYKKTTSDDLIKIYGKIADNDWLEKHLFCKYSDMGSVVFFFINIVLFGLWGVVLWAIYIILTTISVFGFFSLTHVYGYKNFDTHDNSYNLMSLGMMFIGEELHNNHHQNPRSANLAHLNSEFDLGWLYIRILKKLNLVTICGDSSIEIQNILSSLEAK
jgi:stearoyl-CoA desaturase (delta-9 desaturase)